MDLTHLTRHEHDRQRSTLNLIASENYPSPEVLGFLGSVWSNKYAEGYPGKRYYAGNIHTDELETYVRHLALEVFDPTGEYAANVQVLSGSPSNAMVYLSTLSPGDLILSLSLADGGHLSHLHATSAYRSIYRHATYGVKRGPDGFEIDVDDFSRAIDTHRPALVIIGFSAYPRAFEFGPLIRLAHEGGALVLADIAHINGLVAAGLHPTPFAKGVDGADFVTMTTHKTMRGPRGAMVFSKRAHSARLDQTVFPGTSGGPHLHQMTAIGRALQEIKGEESYPDARPFVEYAQAIRANAQAMERGLTEGGLIIATPTQTHLSLVTLPEDADSLQIQRRLESLGIITNRNQIPGDTKSAWRPSGLRLGTAALSSRGLDEPAAHALGSLVASVIVGNYDPDEVTETVSAMVRKLTWYYES